MSSNHLVSKFCSLQILDLIWFIPKKRLFFMKFCVQESLARRPHESFLRGFFSQRVVCKTLPQRLLLLRNMHRDKHHPFIVSLSTLSGLAESCSHSLGFSRPINYKRKRITPDSSQRSPKSPAAQRTRKPPISTPQHPDWNLTCIKDFNRFVWQCCGVFPLIFAPPNVQNTTKPTT